MERRVTGSRQPPVNEVVLSVALAPQDLLIGPRLPEILGSFFNKYNKIEVVPPYNMPHEYQSPQDGLLRNGTPRLELVPTGGIEPRYWLTPEDNIFVIQVQRDYLAFNWRRREGDQEYVRYDTIREHFGEILSTAGLNLAAKGGQLLPERAEVTYINVITPNPVWKSPSDTHRLFATNFSDSQDYEQFAFSYSKALFEPDGPWVGRMHVTLNPTYDWLKEEPRLSLNITARSSKFNDSNLDTVFNFLDLAHRSIDSTFLRMLTAEAREMWGLTDGE
jgi:uncharacterized protein (TIGR04255 family)